MGASQSTRKITLVNDDKAGVIKLSESLAYRLRGQIEGQQATAAAEPPPPPPSPAPAPPPSPAPAPPQPIPIIPQVPEAPKLPQIVPEPFIPEPAPPPPPPLIPDPVPEPPTPLPPAPPPPPEPTAVEAPAVADTPAEKLIPESSSVSNVVEVAATAAAVEESGTTVTQLQPDVGVAVRAGSGPTLSQPGGNIPPWSIYAEEAHLMVMRLREEKEQELQQLNRDWREKMEAREQEFSKMSQLSEEEVNNAIKEVEKLFVKASCTPVCQEHQESVMTCYQEHPRQALRCSRQVEDFARCVDLSRLQSVLRERTN